MKSRVLSPLLLAVVAAVLGAGCHTMRFELADGTAAPGKVVHERKSFYFWGLAPTRLVDASTQCPTGVAAIREQTTVGDGALGFITLGIYSPRTSWYYCLPETAGGVR